jgi:hypothetical protein
VILPEVITVPDVDLPAPIKLIPDIEIPLDKVHEPAGRVTVSPGDDEFITDWRVLHVAGRVVPVLLVTGADGVGGAIYLLK